MKKQLKNYIISHYHKATFLTAVFSVAMLLLCFWIGYIQFNLEHQEIGTELAIITIVFTGCAALISAFYTLVKRYDPKKDDNHTIINLETDNRYDHSYKYKLGIVITPFIFCSIFIFSFRVFASTTPGRCESDFKTKAQAICDTLKTNTSIALPNIIAKTIRYDKEMILENLLQYEDSLAEVRISTYPYDSACKTILKDNVHAILTKEKYYNIQIQSLMNLSDRLNDNIKTYLDTEKIAETIINTGISNNAAIVLYYNGNIEFGDPIPADNFLLKLQYLAMGKRSDKIEVLNVHRTNEYIDTIYLNTRK